MSTTAPTRVTDLARNYRLDCNTTADPGTNYEQLPGVEEMKLIIEMETTPDRTYEDAGAMREEVVGYSWRIEGKIKNSLNAAGTSRNSVHAFLRTKFLALRTAAAAQSEFGIRWYHREGISGEAHEGRVYVKSFPPDGGQGQDTIPFVLMGQGAIGDITNPAASQVPVITTISPSSFAAAGGEVMQIFGDHFTGATAVEFDGTPLDTDAWQLISDSQIVVATPADSGTVAVTVVTPAGESAGSNVTFA